MKCVCNHFKGFLLIEIELSLITYFRNKFSRNSVQLENDIPSQYYRLPAPKKCGFYVYQYDKGQHIRIIL